METTKKKLSLRKEEIASFDEQRNVKGGAESELPQNCTLISAWSCGATYCCDTQQNGCIQPETRKASECICATNADCVSVKPLYCYVTLTLGCVVEETKTPNCFVGETRALCFV